MTKVNRFEFKPFTQPLQNFERLRIINRTWRVEHVETRKRQCGIIRFLTRGQYSQKRILALVHQEAKKILSHRSYAPLENLVQFERNYSLLIQKAANQNAQFSRVSACTRFFQGKSEIKLTQHHRTLNQLRATIRQAEIAARQRMNANVAMQVIDITYHLRQIQIPIIENEWMIEASLTQPSTAIMRLKQQFDALPQIDAREQDLYREKTILKARIQAKIDDLGGLFMNAYNGSSEDAIKGCEIAIEVLKAYDKLEADERSEILETAKQKLFFLNQFIEQFQQADPALSQLLDLHPPFKKIKERFQTIQTQISGQINNIERVAINKLKIEELTTDTLKTMRELNLLPPNEILGVGKLMQKFKALFTNDIPALGKVIQKLSPLLTRLKLIAKDEALLDEQKKAVKKIKAPLKAAATEAKKKLLEIKKNDPSQADAIDRLLNQDGQLSIAQVKVILNEAKQKATRSEQRHHAEIVNGLIKMIEKRSEIIPYLEVQPKELHTNQDGLKVIRCVNYDSVRQYLREKLGMLFHPEDLDPLPEIQEMPFTYAKTYKEADANQELNDFFVKVFPPGRGACFEGETDSLNKWIGERHAEVDYDLLLDLRSKEHDMLQTLGEFARVYKEEIFRKIFKKTHKREYQRHTTADQQFRENFMKTTNIEIKKEEFLAFLRNPEKKHLPIPYKNGQITEANLEAKVDEFLKTMEG